MKCHDRTVFPLVALLALGACADEATTPSGAEGTTSADEVASTGQDDASTGEAPEGSSSGAEDPTEEEGSTGDPSMDPTGPLDGPTLYVSLCSGCHGMTGEGTVQGYELRHPTREHATWVVRNGRVGGEFPGVDMAAFGPDQVSDVQLAQIWDWLDAWPQPTVGAALYEDYCRDCHGANAGGGSVGVSIRGENYLKIWWTARIGAHLSDVGSRGGYMPAFAAERLTDPDLSAITEYIGTL